MAAVEDTNGNHESLNAVEQRIVKQIEYYFGNKNFPRDKFLRQKAEEDDGWVSFECLQTFSRLKAMSVENQTLAEAIKKSKSQLLEVSEDNEKVRRNKSVPLPENTVEARQVAKAKTIYCKGFPKDTTLDELEDFFTPYGKVVYIMMRRIFQSKEFKGSVFVEFSTLEDAKKFLGEEKSTFKDEELIKMSRDDYYKKKEEEKSQHKEEERKRKAQEQLDREKSKQEKEEKEEIAVVSGSVLHFKGVGEQTSREDLKEMFGAHEEIDWVDFAREDTEGYIRFTTEGAAQRAIDAVKSANDGKICIREVETEVRVLEGEEEKKYFQKASEEKQQKRQKKADKTSSSKRGRGGGRGGRGGRGRSRDHSTREKRPRDDDNKTVKTEEKGNTHVRFDDDGPSAAKQIKSEADN